MPESFHPPCMVVHAPYMHQVDALVYAEVTLNIVHAIIG